MDHLRSRWLVFFICLITIATGFGTAPSHASAEWHPLWYAKVPILMYHYIRVNPKPRDRVGADLSVSPSKFQQEMALLYRDGYHTITLDDLRAAVIDGEPLPSHPVILTFDDGYEDFYTAAYPVLKEYGFKATSFVITAKVGWKGYLTWDEMREMQSSGLAQFESHTVNHVALSAISLARAKRELVNSKAALESELGRPVLYVCYPSGRYNSSVVMLAESAGYAAGTTTHYGTIHSAADLLTLSRVRIHGAESLAGFAAAIGAQK